MSTEAEDTDVSVPVLACGAGTSLDSFVVELASWAVDSADEAVVGLATWAFTLVGNVVVDSSAGTCHTGDSVPG